MQALVADRREETRVEDLAHGEEAKYSKRDATRSRRGVSAFRARSEHLQREQERDGHSSPASVVAVVQWCGEGEQRNGAESG
jgi:hypothetical protein